MDSQKTLFKTALGFILFLISFFIVAFFLSDSIVKVAPNTNSLFGIVCSFVFAFPMGIYLFFNSKFSKAASPYQRILFPVLIFPICILFSLGWNLYQQRPENLFRIFVMDPIPDGISNIQGIDISGGFDMEIILAFNAMPEAIDKIILENGLALYNKDTALYFLEDPDYQYFQNIDWDRSWEIYERHSLEKVEAIAIWINPQKDTVIFRLISG